MTEGNNNIARLLDESMLALSVKKLTSAVHLLKSILLASEANRREKVRKDQTHADWMGGASAEVIIHVAETCLWARKFMENVEGKEYLRNKHGYEVKSVEYRCHQAEGGGGNEKKDPCKIELEHLLSRIIHAEIMQMYIGLPEVKPSYLLVESDRYSPIEVDCHDFIKGLESLCLSEYLVLYILLDKAIDCLTKPIQREDMFTPNVTEKIHFIQAILHRTEGGEVIRQHYLKKMGKNIMDYKSPGEIRCSTITRRSGGQMVLTIDNGDIFIELPLAEALDILRQNYPLRITKYS